MKKGEITDSEHLRFKDSDGENYIYLSKYEWEKAEDSYHKEVKMGAIRSHDRLTKFEEEIKKYEFENLKEELRESDKWWER